MNEFSRSAITTEQLRLGDRLAARVTSMLQDALGASRHNTIPDAWSDQVRQFDVSADFDLAEPAHILSDDYRAVSVRMFEYDNGTYFYGISFKREPGDKVPALELYSDTGSDVLAADGLEAVFGISSLPISKLPHEKRQIVEGVFKEALDQLDATVASKLDSSESEDSK